MPALDALLPRFSAAHTLPVGISVDSKYSHAAFASAVGGIRFPLLADFQPKGAVADSFGLYLEGPGITDRATVLIDAGGTIRHISSVGPGGKRDMDVFAALAEEIDGAWDGELPRFDSPTGLPAGATLYIRDNCMFSRWALYTRANLGLSLPVKNVSTDAAALKTLTDKGGKGQAPALDLGDRVLYESDAIAEFLAEHCALP